MFKLDPSERIYAGTVQRVRAFWVSDDVLAEASADMTRWRGEVVGR